MGKPDAPKSPPSPVIAWGRVYGPSGNIVAFRKKLPAGWLVRPVPPSAAFCYVPDPDHRWTE